MPRSRKPLLRPPWQRPVRRLLRRPGLRPERQASGQQALLECQAEQRPLDPRLKFRAQYRTYPRRCCCCGGGLPSWTTSEPATCRRLRSWATCPLAPPLPPSLPPPPLRRWRPRWAPPLPLLRPLAPLLVAPPQLDLRRGLAGGCQQARLSEPPSHRLAVASRSAAGRLRLLELRPRSRGRRAMPAWRPRPRCPRQRCRR
mmetsp:Transcript_14823/g.51983  ORF Transcript_14823/g.51983 Transcript_14823/m.51983 type:complete len:200 (-) Transcript_14823:136-735(-)